MVEDLNALKVQNEQEAEILEKIFVEKQKAEKEIENLDKQLLRHQMLTENRVQDMNPKMKSKYSDLKQESLQVIFLFNYGVRLYLTTDHTLICSFILSCAIKFSCHFVFKFNF